MRPATRGELSKADQWYMLTELSPNVSTHPLFTHCLRRRRRAPSLPRRRRQQQRRSLEACLRFIELHFGSLWVRFGGCAAPRIFTQSFLAAPCDPITCAVGMKQNQMAVLFTPQHRNWPPNLKPLPPYSSSSPHSSTPRPPPHTAKSDLTLKICSAPGHCSFISLFSAISLLIQ